MKIIKRIFQICLTLIVLLSLAFFAIISHDSIKTSYLTIDKEEPTTYLIINANVVPMNTDTVLFNQQVYIENGFVKAIGDTLSFAKAELIDIEHNYIMPGLMDMHVHVWDEYELGLYLAHGVTTVRNVWGLPMHLRMKRKIIQDKIYSPLFFTTGPKLTGPEYMGDDNLQITSEREAKEKVKAYKKRGYDFIKTYNGLPEDIFSAIIGQASLEKMDIVAHPSQKVPYAYHFHPQISSIEHAEDIVQQPLNYQLDTTALNQLLPDFQNAPNVSFCPTLVVYHNISRLIDDEDILMNDSLKWMNPLIKRVDSKAQYDRWQTSKANDEEVGSSIKNQHEFHLKIIKKLHEAGVNLVCGTDAGIGITIPGATIHQELAFYRKAGLSNYEVLKTATVNASRTHQVMKNAGTLERGKIANLLVVVDNPIENLTTLQKPKMVFIKGRKLDTERLLEFKDKAGNRSNLLITGFRYLENMLIEK